MTPWAANPRHVPSPASKPAPKSEAEYAEAWAKQMKREPHHRPRLPGNPEPRTKEVPERERKAELEAVVLAAMRGSHRLTASDMAKATGMHVNTVFGCLNRMRRRRLVDCARVGKTNKAAYLWYVTEAGQ